MRVACLASGAGWDAVVVGQVELDIERVGEKGAEESALALSIM